MASAIYDQINDGLAEADLMKARNSGGLGAGLVGAVGLVGATALRIRIRPESSWGHQ